jgi:hypothetical protein
MERDVVDLDATLGEQLFEVPVGQPVPQVPAHRNKLTSGGKPNPAKPEGILTGGLGRRVCFIATLTGPSALRQRNRATSAT